MAQSIRSYDFEIVSNRLTGNYLLRRFSTGEVLKTGLTLESAHFWAIHFNRQDEKKSPYRLAQKQSLEVPRRRRND
jgi:hypothetical protein